MLYKEHLLPRLNIVGESGSEIEIKSPKIHLPEILPVVHVEKIVNVGCPTNVVTDRLLVMSKQNRFRFTVSQKCGNVIKSTTFRKKNLMDSTYVPIFY